ncbi:MAG: uracil-DNA glycosylase [Candidatus Zixiibacteriota bacterium]|nr:MAG: uracil-DNA glycosylase [candidate division Zixibacteria bacterium]
MARTKPATPKERRVAKQEEQGGLNPYPDYAPYPDLQTMFEAIRGCLKCDLGPTRTKFVFGTGARDARVVFIGEGPGEQEDLKGEPFVGRAGALLNKLLEDIDWRREDVYIANMVKCRPPHNRDPLPDEIAMCEPYLHEQLRLIQPQLLVALGRISAQALLRTKTPLGKLRGQVHRFGEFPLWVTYHPAALLRNQDLLPAAHQDFETLKSMVNSGRFSG